MEMAHTLAYYEMAITKAAKSLY